MSCASNIARPARPCARCVNRFMHCGQNNRMLPHAKVVIPTPNCDVLFAAIWPRPNRMRKLAILALNIDEGPVAAFFVKLVQCGVEFGVKIQPFIPVSQQRTP